MHYTKVTNQLTTTKPFRLIFHFSDFKKNFLTALKETSQDKHTPRTERKPAEQRALRGREDCFSTYQQPITCWKSKNKYFQKLVIFDIFALI